MALKYCYPKALKQVERMVLQNGGTVEDAKDLFHDSLIILNNNCKQQQFNLTSTISTYLYSVCRFSWFNKKKKDLKSQSLQQVSIYENTEELAYKNTTDRVEVLMKSLEAVGDRCKEILMDYYFGKFSYEEIAVNLSYSSAQVVRQQKYRCIQRLKEMTDYE